MADYKPGSNGEIGGGLFHYKCEIDAKVWNGTSMKQKTEMIKSIENSKSLDGNGNVYLALQVRIECQFNVLRPILRIYP